MNLIIDAGNTKIKVALFEGKDIILKKEVDELNHILAFTEEASLQKIKASIFSSVRKVPSQFIHKLAATCPKLICFSQNTAIPLTIAYKTPHSLGLDRIASAVGAKMHYAESAVLVIDAGTAITFDLITADNIFLGGNISPGLLTRFKALHNFTGKLPLIKPDPDSVFIGTETEEAIRAGVQNGIIFETEAYIDRLSKEYPQLKIVLTGGDADFFVKKIKSSIFVDSNLVLKGLNKILRFNL